MSAPVPQVPADLTFVTLAALAAFLGSPELAIDAKAKPRLVEVLQAATEYVESRVGPLDQAAYTYQVSPNGRHLVLPDTHLVRVNSIVGPGGEQLVIDPAGMNLLAGVLSWGYRLRPGTYLVTALTREHGAAVALAVKIIASHLYDVHRGTLVGPRAVAATPVGDVPPLRGFAIPNRASELLRPFLRSGV